jgi:tripartite-type tricarboxylate transporter receptor subunit TctC
VWERAMKLARRKFLRLAVGSVALPAVSRVARAQTYPTRPITMIVPNGAGGANDSLARIVAERMRNSLGQPIIIENVSGADGTLGTARAVRAKPDGYTLSFGSVSTHSLNAAFYSLSYDLINDFVPVAALAATPVILYSRKDMQANDLSELIIWLKANPGKSAAITTAAIHLITAFFARETGTQFTLIPYRAGPTAAQDLLTGQIDLWFNPPNFLSLVRSGALKGYAVTSDVRLDVAPEIPTFAEAGLPALSFAGWYGLFVPKGTPKNIVANLNSAAIDTLADPSARSHIIDLGMVVFRRDQQTPDALAAMQKVDAEKWRPLVRAFGIKGE